MNSDTRGTERPELSQAAIQSLVSDIADALSFGSEYFEDRSDVSDGDYGEPRPNKEMQLAQIFQQAMDSFDRLLQVLP